MAYKNETIDAVVDDLVMDFLYYDRKEDDDLGVGDIEIAISQGQITIDEIVERFKCELVAGINYKE